MDVLLLDRIRGCLLGGAIGDALGAAVEFESWSAIAERHGLHGVTGMLPAYGRVGAITDDTQMTMFTVEGLIRASVRVSDRGFASVPDVVWHAYQRWLTTQYVDAAGARFGSDPDGWLISVPGLHTRRAPGTTCLSALGSGAMGRIGAPTNDSKGCGGVMRVAPAGLVGLNATAAFDLGAELAALTHGHPGGYLPAGVLAAIVAELCTGSDLPDATARGTALLSAHPGHEEPLRLLRAACELPVLGLSPSAVETLGRGWVGDEALAIAVACALGATDFRHGVLAAVNHSGDSDSTGSVCGSLLGARWGVGAIPPEWLDVLELRDELDALAHDLHRQFHPRFAAAADAHDWSRDEWAARYPPW